MAQELIQKVDETYSAEHFSEVLRKRTKMLNIYSFAIIISLLTGLVFFLLLVTAPFIDHIFFDSDKFMVKSTFLYLGYGSLFIGIIFLFAFSNLRKRSYAYYEVFTDELEWGTENFKSETTPIEYKIAIKEFLKSSDLPFADSSKLGQLIYLALFIGLIIALAYFSNTIN